MQTDYRSDFLEFYFLPSAPARAPRHLLPSASRSAMQNAMLCHAEREGASVRGREPGQEKERKRERGKLCARVCVCVSEREFVCMRACVRECARGCAGVNICVCVGALTDGSLVCLFVCVRASSRVLFCVHGYEIFREGCNVRHKKAIYTHKHAHTRTYIHTHTHIGHVHT